MGRYKTDPDRKLMDDARLWASKRAGIQLVYANETTEPGARWIRYYPAPFAEAAVVPGRPYAGGGGCWMLLRPSNAKRAKRYPVTGADEVS